MARKLQADEWLFACVVALALFGVIMVYSASAIVAAGEGHPQYYYVLRQGAWTLIGLGALITGMRTDYGRLRSPWVAYGLLALLRLARLYEEVGGFGTLLVIGHEWEPGDAWHRSMRLLAEEVLPRLPTLAKPTLA